MYLGTIWACRKFSRYDYVVSNWRHLIDIVSESCGKWKVIFSNTLDPDKIEGNILFAIKPQEIMHSVPRPVDDILNPLSSLPHDIKLITLHDDIHLSTGRQFRAVLDRSDIILTTYWSPFLKRWPEYENKAIHFPFFLLPCGLYENMPYNTNPINKCLVSGFPAGINTRVYPLRDHIFRQWYDHPEVRPTIEKYIHPLSHPGYAVPAESKTGKPTYIGAQWANELNKYFCALSDCSIYGYTVAKYMEIPAAGALLVANESEDMELLGFEDSRNYVKVRQDDVIDKITDILLHPSAYEAIRTTGRSHALNNFGYDATIRRFMKAVEY